MRTRAWATAGVIVAALAGAPSREARATVMVRVAVDEMADAAELVVVATARRATGRWVNGRVYTDVECVVEDVARGGVARGSAVVVRTPGGAVGDVGQRVEGAPVLAPGERFVLFLRRAASGQWETVALAQGALPVRDGRVYPAGAEGVLYVERGGRPAGPRAATIAVPAEGVAVAALVSAVRGRARR